MISFFRTGRCAIRNCGRKVVPAPAQGAISAYCSRHSVKDDPTYSDLLQKFDETMRVAEATPVSCSAPSCSAPVGSRFPQFFPACRQQCLKLYRAAEAHKGDFNAQLDALGDCHARASVQDSSWETYATGIRMWMRFRLAVQRRHPSQLDGTHPDGTPRLERDAEQQLIRFVEWLGFAGTLAPAQRGGYVSAVKAAHLMWFGCPYEAISLNKFFKLSRILKGMIKLHKGVKSVLREGMLRPHFVKIFQWIDDTLAGRPSGICVTRPMEAILVTMWQGIFRPDECVGTPKNKTFPRMDQVVFRDAYGAPVAYSTPYENINYCEFDPDGRKNDPGRTNPPVILAADHSMASRRFSACFQLYSLFNLVSPPMDRLSAIPLFPTRAKGPIFSPFDYDGLGKLVRRVMSWVFRCKETDAKLTPYTAYALRIGGAVALHDAGADGLVIAAMGQWHQIYIRAARHKAMAWTVRMSRGLQAKL